MTSLAILLYSVFFSFGGFVSHRSYHSRIISVLFRERLLLLLLRSLLFLRHGHIMGHGQLRLAMKCELFSALNVLATIM